MKLADKLKGKSRVKWTQIRGERVGLKILTLSELNEYQDRLGAVEDTRGVFEVFGEQITDADGGQALTVEEMEDVLTNAELKRLLQEFNEANGAAPDDTEKN